MPEKVIVRDWRKLQAYLLPTLEKHQCDVVSLDIFDTLLARIETPEQVQRGVCRLLSKRLGKPFTPEQVWDARQHVERSLREQSVADGLDYECRFSELVPCWLETLTGRHDSELTAFVLATELKLEKQALYVKAGTNTFLQWLQKHDARIHAISDMYLDLPYIEELLADKGLLKYFDQVYVSADSCLCKYSGRLFQHIAAVQAIALDRWFHIGDNPVSDRSAPCKLGIQGILLYEKQELRRREQQQLSADMSAEGGLWKGQHFFSVLQQSLRVGNPDNHDKGTGFYFRYGRDFLGGAFSTFTLGLHERLQRKPVSKVLFVARDGYLFREMYQQLDNRLDDEYIYLSRKVITAAATANGLTLEQSQVAFYNPKQQGLRSVFKVYGLPENDLAPLAQRHGFTDVAEPVHDWHDPRLKNFLADEQVQACIRPVGKRHYDLLAAYLEQVGFFGNESIALVDIGWNGTVQKFLKQAFGEREDFPRVHGYYFAFVPKMYNDFGANNFCEGIIHDSRRDNACERIPAEFEEIFEQCARAQAATTVGYQEVNGQIKPVLKSDDAPDRQAELACNPLVAQMQSGVLEHWRHFLAVQQLSGYDSLDLLPYVYGQLERAIVYPDKEESRMLTRLVHTEDFGDDHVLDLGRDALSLRDLLKPLQLWQKLRDAAWRYALFAGIPTGIANFAFRMVYLHAVKK